MSESAKFAYTLFAVSFPCAASCCPCWQWYCWPALQGCYYCRQLEARSMKILLRGSQLIPIHLPQENPTKRAPKQGTVLGPPEPAKNIENPK
eukprot:604860-Amphidinium_carterae.1